MAYLVAPQLLRRIGEVVKQLHFALEHQNKFALVKEQTPKREEKREKKFKRFFFI